MCDSPLCTIKNLCIDAEKWSGVKNVFTTHAQRKLISVWRCDCRWINWTRATDLPAAHFWLRHFQLYLCFYTVITKHTEEFRGLVEPQRPFLNWCQEMSSWGITGHHIWMRHPLQIGQYDSGTTVKYPIAIWSVWSPKTHCFPILLTFSSAKAVILTYEDTFHSCLRACDGLRLVNHSWVVLNQYVDQMPFSSRW